MRSCNHALGEKMAGRFGWAVREWFKYKKKLGDRMIKQLSNPVIAKYCDLSMSRRSIICLSLRLRQIIDLLATDKSQYFAQPRPIIVNYSLKSRWMVAEYWNGEVNILPLFTEIEKNNCFSIYTLSDLNSISRRKNRFRNTGETRVYNHHFVFVCLTHCSLGKGWIMLISQR